MENVVGNNVVSTHIAKALPTSDLKSCLLVARDWGGPDHPFRKSLHRRSMIRLDRDILKDSITEDYHSSMTHFFYTDRIQRLDEVTLPFWSKVGPRMTTLKLYLRFDGREELEGIREILGHLDTMRELQIILKDEGETTLDDGQMPELLTIIQSFEKLKMLDTLQITRQKSAVPIKPAVFTILNEMFKSAFSHVQTVKWYFGDSRPSVVRAFAENWDIYVGVVKEYCPRIKDMALGVNPLWFCATVEFEVVVRRVKRSPRKSQKVESLPSSRKKDKFMPN